MKWAKDASAIGGLGMLAAGLWLHSPALALSVVGAILLSAGVYGHMRMNAAPKPITTEGDE